MKAVLALSLVVLTAPSLCSANNQIERFDLRCTSADSSASPHTFHIDVSDEGDVSVSQPSVSNTATYEASTYANAFVWEADGVRYIAERFKGELTTFPETFKWQCAKVGGKKF